MYCLTTDNFKAELSAQSLVLLLPGEIFSGCVAATTAYDGTYQECL